MSIAADGSFSDGFSTNVFPQAIAFANIHMGTMAGKLNGVMPATTPRGWRIEYTSTPVPACSLNPPFRRCGTPQANSTFSTPRATSPSASVITFPCSEVIDAARSARRASSAARARNMISERRDRESARHCGKASDAASTARSTSPGEARSTSACCRPLAGSKTGPLRPESPGTMRPPIQWLMRRIALSSPSARSP